MCNINTVGIPKGAVTKHLNCACDECTVNVSIQHPGPCVLVHRDGLWLASGLVGAAGVRHGHALGLVSQPEGPLGQTYVSRVGHTGEGKSLSGENSIRENFYPNFYFAWEKLLSRPAGSGKIYRPERAPEFFWLYFT